MGHAVHVDGKAAVSLVHGVNFESAAPRLKSKVTVRLVRASHKPNVLRSPVGFAMTALAVMNATPGGQPIAIAKDMRVCGRTAV